MVNHNIQTVSSIILPRAGMLGGLQPVKGSLGILMPGQEARIVREDGSDADVNEPGELWLRGILFLYHFYASILLKYWNLGRNIALGYWQDEAATKEAFLPDGWLRTGDRMRADANGVFLYVPSPSSLIYSLSSLCISLSILSRHSFEDRVKDTLKVSGAQVAPAELENTLLEHPEQLIIDVAVAGVLPSYATSASEERVPRAWVVLSATGRVHEPEEVVKKLEAWSRERLSKYKWLKGGIGIVDSIPKNPTGKVLRRVLRDEYEKMLSKSLQVKAKL